MYHAVRFVRLIRQAADALSSETDAASTLEDGGALLLCQDRQGRVQWEVWRYQLEKGGGFTQLEH